MITEREISEGPTSGQIVISYRRSGGSWPARWLTDKLTDRFGPGVVFQDVDSIRLGDDFAAELVAGVKECLALLVVIDPQWLGVGDDGGRRIDNPKDWVRTEVETAISSGRRIIPILVAGARMPDAEELPPSMQSLARRQAVTLDPAHPDIRRLVSELKNEIKLGRRVAGPQGALDRLGRAASGLLVTLRLRTGG